MSTYDVAVIGSGPGGYVAAIRCAQLGLKTAIIEKYSTMGGTCLNVGCIPSKALLDSSHHFEDALKHFEDHGIEIPGEVKLNLEKMMGRKATVVEQTTKGIAFLMDKNKVDTYEGIGSFKDKTHINIASAEGEDVTIEAKHTIIATGSKPSSLPFIDIDKERIITSTEALKLKEVPKHMLVIGGGVIGLELGQVYKRLGAEVTVIEYMDRIIPTMDAAQSKELAKVMKKQKVKFALSHKVTAVENTGDEVVIKATDKKGKEVEFKGDYCLVSVGRKPFTDGL
ncbi:MAG: dihydrolipoyl dehydrogenase family protein, partial [Mesonia sp.]|uniref:dihydrolipoyl dehydrogenase family protein n=1 Tax=Mesonia sp. TaxID=1960830 RepID=UPI003F9478EA